MSVAEQATELGMEAAAGEFLRKYFDGFAKTHEDIAKRSWDDFMLNSHYHFN